MSQAGEIGFVEEFALADDRAKAIEQLVPGTEDYYYYRCLHLQNRGEFDEVDEAMELWRDRYGETSGYEEIRNRQVLLRYDRDPSEAMSFLKRHFGLYFDHQRRVPDAEVTLPSALDRSAIGRETLKAKALSSHSDLSGFSDPGLWLLEESDLKSVSLLRDLLDRLDRPDFPGVVNLIMKELGDRRSSGFGSKPIHNTLTLAQLRECAKRDKDLLGRDEFVGALLLRMQPGPDSSWESDPAEKKEYLRSLMAFVRTLPDSQMSLKAHVLYHNLAFDLTQGACDRKLFDEYAALPRATSYISSKLKKRGSESYSGDLDADYESATLLPAIGSDEVLVGECLSRFFNEGAKWEDFRPLMKDEFLKKLYARTMILAGTGDVERWYALLDDPAEYQELKERVDIEFAPSNGTYFAPRDSVALDVWVKNVETLIVKVFEINTTNYYRQTLSEIDTSIDLDGLVARTETTWTYDESPFKRALRRFEFPELSRRGVFVIELIGNGRSSRALIRKGRFRMLERTGAAGHVFTVLDEDNHKLDGAVMWMQGHEYRADERGRIAIPYSTDPIDLQPVVLTVDGASTLSHFSHQGESYSLDAGFYVDRESLLRGAKASVLIRPVLYVNGIPASLKLLEDVALSIRSTDLDGVSSTLQVPDFELHEDSESLYEFRVPERLSRVEFALSARVRNVSEGRKDGVSTEASFGLNQIDASTNTQVACLSRDADGFILTLVGKTGEVLASRPLQITLTHREFTDSVRASLQTTDEGVVDLGALDGIDTIQVNTPEGCEYKWNIEADRHSPVRVVHALAGESIRIPYMDAGSDDERLALFEKRGGANYAECTDSIAVKDGFLQIGGLDGGEYELRVGADRVSLSVAAGELESGHVLSKKRLLEQSNASPLQIASVDLGADTIRIAVANGSDFARVHAFATRYVPAYDAMHGLGALAFPLPRSSSFDEPDSNYVSGRDIGDEYRYILDRRYAEKFPGNMLKRPSLLLNPWAKDEAEATRDLVGAIGGAYDSSAKSRKRGARRPSEPKPQARASDQFLANLDFLPAPTRTFVNLKPNAEGIVEIARSELGDAQFVRIVGVDPLNTVTRDVLLARGGHVSRDLRLSDSLDPAKHYTERKAVSIVRPGEIVVVRDIASAKIEIYDSLAKAHRLLATISGGGSLLHPLMKEFEFIVRWPKLTLDEKRAKYSEYACHEFHYFLYCRDPEFFDGAIRPYLANKRDKTFLDDALLKSDLRRYLPPWEYARLNALERVLLGRAVDGERPAAARIIRELCELNRPDLDDLNRLFQTAVSLGAMETGDELGLEAAKEEMADAKGEAMPRMMSAKKRMMKSVAMDEDVSDLLADECCDEEAEMEPPVPPMSAGAGDGFFGGDDIDLRSSVRQFYRGVEKTKEWVENNYYHVLIENHTLDLIPPGRFWLDMAEHEGDGFLSSHLAEAVGSFPSMLMALASLDLPFESPKHDVSFKDGNMELAAAGPLIAYQKEIAEVEVDAAAPILVSQNFFDPADRYVDEGDEEVEKYVVDEFVAGAVYGCKIVLTNPTSSSHTLDVLLQVPQGAVPVQCGFFTRGRQLRLDSYETESLEYYFYFPLPGAFRHYPVHVARDEKVVAFAAPREFNVVAKPERVDETSWAYVSQNGSEDDVVRYLEAHNVARTDLDEIAWRMADDAFFTRITSMLSSVHSYSDTLWAYGIHHEDAGTSREYLKHRDEFVSACGKYLESPLVSIDPVERRSYQHMEYSPLVNARAHRFSRRRQIPNVRFLSQYRDLMSVLTYRAELDDDDLLSVVYCLLLQDRIADAIQFFGRIDGDKVEGRIQYDYASAYLKLSGGDTAAVRTLATQYAQYPVDRWRNVFREVMAQIDEVEGQRREMVDEEDRNQTQDALASSEPSIEVQMVSSRMNISYRNVSECRLSYYLMDLELLFSRNPFVQEHTGQFSFVRPNETAVVKLSDDSNTCAVDVPEQFRSANVMIEIEAAGVRRSIAYYASALAVELVENYGQLRVTHEETAKPLSGVYVKVYARRDNGGVEFYKDGYTDMRGRFDYVSLSDEGQGAVARFAVLVSSESDGGVVREAAPPKR